LQLRLDRIKSKAVSADDDTILNLQQNAKIVVDAENYYRAMIESSFGRRDRTWNIRDKHMMDTLNTLLEYFGPDSKAICWLHNTHIGDSRFTSMAQSGEYNIGQLAREQHGEDKVALVGFSTHQGTVIASNRWGGKITEFVVPQSRAGSVDNMLHRAANDIGAKQYYLHLRSNDARKVLTETGAQRAIGVVYNPGVERFGNYVCILI